jgi:hypothetical protein
VHLITAQEVTGLNPVEVTNESKKRFKIERVSKKKLASFLEESEDIVFLIFKAELY